MHQINAASPQVIALMAEFAWHLMNKKMCLAEFIGWLPNEQHKLLFTAVTYK